MLCENPQSYNESFLTISVVYNVVEDGQIKGHLPKH